MAFSIIIKNGTIIDGVGEPSFLGDIGITNENISKIGDLSSEKADFVFDASGFLVSPGFIDVTSHSDVYGTLFFAPLQESMITQGVTTILMGNCGESLAPISNKESLLDLERWTQYPINANWNSVKEYLNAIEKNGVGINCATLVGQETLRRNTSDLNGQLFLLEQSLKEGAFGLSSNFSFLNLSENWEEETKIFLQKVRKHGGLYKIHLRDEGKDFLPAVVSAVDLARKTGVRAVISHFKAMGRGSWPDFKKAQNILEIAKESGVEISFDVFPYLRTGSQLLSLLPSWAREGNNKEILEKLNSASSAEHIIYDLKKITLHPERILIASASEDKKIVGKTLERVASELEKNAEETIVEILKTNNLNATIFGRNINSQNLAFALKKNYSAVSSDGAGYNLDFKNSGNLVHPRSFGAFSRFISKIAPFAGLQIEEAIKKITSIPASMLGLKNRGVLKNNFTADIVVFDKNDFKDKSTYLNPYKYSSGVKLVLLSGRTAFLNEKVLGKFGKVLRKI